MPEIALLLLKLNLGVGDRGTAVGTPVDDSLASIDKSLFVKTDENLLNCLGAALVHGKAFSVPVTA